MNLPTMITAMAVGMAFCAAEAVLSNFAQVYFQNELDQGDPFTLGGARELMRLGILTLSIPLGTRIACSIAISISDHFFPELEKFSFGETSQVGLGLMMLLASLLCRYGAQIKEGMETEMKMKMEMEGEGEKTKDL